MRRLLPAVLTVALIAAEPAHAARCDGPVPNGPRGLPWQVAVHTSCGAFLLHPDGTVKRGHMRPWAPAWVPAGAMRVLRDTYSTRRGGYITLLRAGRTVWRSSRPYRLTTAIVAGRRAIAFSVYDGPLYARAFPGRERVIAWHEEPVGFTRSGLLLTQHWWKNRAVLRVRRLDGSLVRVLSIEAHGVTFDRPTRTLYYVSRPGRLVRFDGFRRTALSPLPFDPRSEWLQTFQPGLVAAFGMNGIHVVRHDGRFFGSIRWHPVTRRHAGTTIDGDAVAPSPRGDAIAFVSRWRGNGLAARERILVSVLRAGARHATVLYRRWAPLTCGGAGRVAWRGRWLLYTGFPGQRLVALDTLRRRRPVDLTPLARRLPGRGAPGAKIAFWAEWR